MAITAISRAWAENPSIVCIIDDAAYSVITANFYWLTQKDIVSAINNGEFVFEAGDMLEILYADGQGWFVFDSENNTFKIQSTGLTEVTGDVTIDSSLVSHITAGAVTKATLAVGINPLMIIKYQPITSTVASQTTYVVSLPGVVPADYISSVILRSNPNSVYVVSASVTDFDQYTVVLSADPGNGSNNIITTIHRIAS